ncbi:MAG TPA: DNA mismatch repair endonuclease MutL [Candidatus Acidoferrales bacterium]|jgi:DNA mismatch repair protein MutL|nr:DNA mismatch repair endonuclease MutL [Candidatus Acidoferrales bacterium]
MGRIRILPDQVANKIAAGEVVERPASVVKELLENSLDAGATDLRVEVEAGGRRLIRIVDDGCGMLRDDALLAFERHATSKLRDVKDLLSITTLGFRGEALPSIASVSRLLLETRAAEEATGTRIEIAGGKMLRCEEAALGGGTAIAVRDLFFNVPARRKFLRTEPTELAHIASLVTHYSLAHPGKTFRLTSGPAELLSVTPVATTKERVYQVFGSHVLEELVDIGVRERELFIPPPSVPPSQGIAEYRSQPGPDDDPPKRTFRLSGFFSRPQVQKGNRNSIYIFVNGRLIRDRLMLHALSSAYHNLMPSSAYPFALLFLEMDAEEVDVNVHPSKTEVRFRHGSFVHDFVRDTIRERLMESRPAPAFSPAPPRSATPPAQMAAQLPYSEFSQMIENEEPVRGSDQSRDREGAVSLAEGTPKGTAATQRVAATGQDTGEDTREDTLPEFTLRPTRGPDPRLDFSAPPIEVTPGPPPSGKLSRRLDMHGEFPADAIPPPETSLSVLSDLRPLGQIHESFIIAAGRDGLWIIDQHVAHERILFEQVLKQRAAGRVEMQRLLMPLILQLTPEQQIDYARIADELHESGFETEPFGNRTIAVKAAPAAVGAADLERVLFEILEIAEGELRGTSLDDLRRNICASIACRAAIKINMRLDAAKMEWLLRALAATDCPMSCPHGRPIAMHYGTREILKAFHRI